MWDDIEKSGKGVSRKERENKIVTLSKEEETSGGYSGAATR